MAGNHRAFRILLLLPTTLAIIWLEAWSVRVFGFCSPMAAFITTWLVTAWLATVAQCIRLPLPPALDDIRSFENAGRIYERLGVRHFRQLVLRSPLSILSRTVRLAHSNSRAALQQLEDKLRRAEAIHVWSLLAVWPLIGYSIMRGWIHGSGWLLLFSLLLNVYPIILQRYNRMRIERLVNQNRNRRRDLTGA